MANVLFTRTDNPDSREIIDGQVLFSTSGDGAIYLDNGTERMKIGENEDKVDKDSVLSTVAECVASTDPEDVAGASTISELQSNLVANNTNFIFDYKDGQYGYNTSPERGADTFFPFKKTVAYALSTELSAGTYNINVAEFLEENHIFINYENLTNNNFILQHIRNNTFVSGGTTDYGIHQGAPRPTADGSDFSFNYNSNTGILTINGGSVRYVGQFSIGSLVRYEEGWSDYHTENAHFNYTVSGVIIPWLIVND